MKELSLYLLDIVQNSIRAKASEIHIVIEENSEEDILSVTINDNGCGIEKDKLEKIYDPFFTTRTSRKVGLGIPMLKMMAEMTGGGLVIDSEMNKGTELKFWFGYTHIDRPDWGDLSGTIKLLLTGNPEIDIFYKHTIDGKEYAISTIDIIEAIGSRKELSNVKTARFIGEMIHENLMAIGLE